MEILVLVCAVAIASPDCQNDTAIHSFHVAASTSDGAGCLREGMMYAAQSGLVQPKSYPKVVCGAGQPQDTRMTAQR